MTTTIEVDSGVCQSKTVITAEMDENMDIVFKVKSTCAAVREMAKGLEAVPLFDAIAMPFSENCIYAKCAALEHVSCPVPCALIKAAEAAGELALKKSATITFQ